MMRNSYNLAPVPQLNCESCRTATSRETSLCAHCLALLCVSCCHKHNCAAVVPSFHRIAIAQPESPQLLKKGPSCQRCQLTAAVRTCLNCRISSLCLSCFTSVHTNKLAHHQFQHILSNQFHKNVKEQSHHEVRQAFQTQAGKLTATLELLRGRLTANGEALKVNTKDLLQSVTEELQEIQEEVRLKRLEVQLKISEQLKMEGEINNEGLTSLQRIACSLSNLKFLTSQTTSLTTYSNNIRNKLQKESTCLQKISKMVDESRSDVPLRISQQFIQEAAQIRQKLRKLDWRRSINHDQSQPILGLKPEKSTQLKFKEPKILKGSLNLASCKSMDKLGLLNLSLASPTNKANLNKAKGFRKDQDPLNITPCESVYAPSESNTNRDLTTSLHREESTSQLLQFSTSKIRNPQEKKGKDIKLRLVTNLNKRGHKNSQNWAKVDGGKSVKNVDNAKKMIIDIRSEMRQFTNRYNFEKEARKQENEDSGLFSSTMSVDSILIPSQQLLDFH